MLQNKIATLFGVGFAPVAPGTFGSLVALPFVIGAQLLLPPMAYLVISAILFFVAVWAADSFVTQSGDSDPSAVVVDEFVGLWIAATWLPATPLMWLLVFVLFRLFDVFKPWPISWADRQKKGGLSVVADDVLAGIIVNVLLQVLLQSGLLQWV